MDPVRLSSWIARDFAVRVAHLEPVGHGADARADLHHVVATDGRAYAAKTSSGPQPGLAVAAHLAGRAVPGVPAPLRTRGGDLTASNASVVGRGEQRLSLVPWLPGRRVLDTGMAPRGWVLLGELLGRLHTSPPSAPELAAVPVEDHDPSATTEQARRFGEVVAGAVASHPDDPVVAEVSSVWAVGRPRLLAVAERVDHLAGSTSWSRAAPVLCHGDPHHGNLLVDPAGQVWLVDWDDAVVAPREADLMFVVGGVFSHSAITDEQVRWFFDGYTPVTGIGPEALDADLLAYLRGVRALVDVLDLLETAASPTGRDAASRAEALRYAAGTLGPGGLVDLALG